MKREDFDFLADLLKRGSGLAMNPGKAPMVTARLKRVAERHGFSAVAALVDALKRGNAPLERAVNEAMATQDTSFFRDAAVFEVFRKAALPKLAGARVNRRLSIWSAGCATGQEAYSLAMLFDRLPQFSGWDIGILATDVSEDAIARAKDGIYTDAEVQRGLSVPMLAKYFCQEPNGWRIGAAIRERVQFRVFNLLESFAGLGPFDAIFCRNVLIYFDSAAKMNILGRLSDVLAEDGCLVLGSAETVLGLSKRFTAADRVRGINMKLGRAPSSLAAAG